MPLLRWKAFEDGLTLGRPGSERGRIVRDDDYADAARITLERDCPTAPFAITCGVYGWMMHTRFFSDLDVAEGEYEAIKLGLAAIVGLIPDVNDPDVDARLHDVSVAIGRSGLLRPNPPTPFPRREGGALISPPL